MSKKLESNKIFASILVAMLLAALSGFIANILYKPNLEVVRGYEIAVPDQSDKAGSELAESGPIVIETIMANANAENGKNIAKKCVSCHSFDKGGANKVGPNLWGIVNAKHAHLSNFNYSKALLNSGGIWDVDDLFAFLHKPNDYLPGTKMTFVGLKKLSDVADIIAYLKTLKD